MKNSKLDVRAMCELALLLAIVLVMAYTPLGYLPVGPLTMSLITIPVAVGAMLVGPMGGMVLGGAFGLTSFANAIQGKSAMGAAMFAINPVGCFVVCVVARILMGLTCALIFMLMKKLLGKDNKVAPMVGGLTAPLFNTIYFMGFLMLLYYNSEYVQGLAAKFGTTGVLPLVIAMVGVQAVIEWGVCCVIAGAVTIALQRVLKR